MPLSISAVTGNQARQSNMYSAAILPSATELPGSAKKDAAQNATGKMQWKTSGLQQNLPATIIRSM